MDSLNSFLNPKRKPNLKFVLSDAYVDDNGKPIEWEMRQVTAAEGMRISSLDLTGYKEIMSEYVAEALVYPDLRDKDLIEGIAEKLGRKGAILSPSEVLIGMTLDSEMAYLIDRYVDYSNLTVNFTEEVIEAKNG